MSEAPIFIHQYKVNQDKSFDSPATIEKPEPDSLLWQHIDLGLPGAITWLQESSNIDTVIFESLTAEETRPRSFTTKNGLLVVLRGVNNNPGNDPEDMVSIRLWIERNRVLSTRNRAMLAVNDIVKSIEAGEPPLTSGEFLTRLVNQLADRIGDFVNSIEDDMSTAEDGLESAEPSQLRAILGTLRRQIASVRRFLAPQRDALDRLNHVDSDILSSRDKQRLREESDRISRYLEDLDLARERAIVLQEAFLSQLAQQQNTRMYVLSVVAAVFLPLTFVTGLLGMNVGGLPGTNNPNGFLIATIIMTCAAFGLCLIFLWKKWL